MRYENKMDYMKDFLLNINITILFLIFITFIFPILILAYVILLPVLIILEMFGLRWNIK